MPRLYVVDDKETNARRLVNANTPGQAIAHVTKGRYEAKPASGDDVADCYEQGIKREDATKGDATTETPSDASGEGEK